MTRHGLTLFEVLVACAMLALVVVACLPLMRTPEPRTVTRADPALAALIATDQTATPPNAIVSTTPARVGDAVEGRWIVVAVGARYAVTWVPDETSLNGTTP